MPTYLVRPPGDLHRCAKTNTTQNSDIVSPDSSFSTRHRGVAGVCFAQVLRTCASDCLTVFISDEPCVEDDDVSFSPLSPRHRLVVPGLLIMRSDVTSASRRSWKVKLA